MLSVDQLIGELDRALRAVTGVARSSRASPAQPIEEAALDEAARAQTAALMRVNYVGEICAQALYQGQSLTARDEEARRAFEQAAREEQDHLAWSADRIRELGGRPSLLNHLWFACSFVYCVADGDVGEKWNCAFLAETDRKVEVH